MFEIRRAKREELKVLAEILEEARKNIAELGIDQWQNSGPQKQDLEMDIENGELFVAIEENQPQGFCYIGLNGEETYNKIYDGAWSGAENYTTIHRVAVASNARGKGVFRALVEFAERYSAENKMEAIRIDTHRGNYKMQSALNKNGFKKMGIIYLKNGDERIAFEKVL